VVDGWPLWSLRPCGVDVTNSRIAYESKGRVVYCESCANEFDIASECQESRRARSARQQRLIGQWSASEAGRRRRN
jgi:hypothetical protein